LEYREKLNEIVQQVCAELGVELVEFDLFQAGSRKLLRLFIDRDGGVSIDDCTAVSRNLGNRLDLEDLIPVAYTLEVSSPGLDRPLKTDRDFQRNMGRLVRVNRGAGAPLVGYLKSVDSTAIVLEIKKTRTDTIVQRADILVAKVEAEL